MVTTYPNTAILPAERIPYITAPEAFSLLDGQLKRFLALLESLEPEEWSRPTACSKWTVHDIVAHQAGGYASGTGYREMARQYSTRPKPGQLPEDAVNDLQVSERAGRSPAELIAELRRVGPVASQKWAYQFRLARLVTIPHPVPGKLSLRHLMWVIHSRDTWMHRLDICRATGRKFEQTADQDGRIAALVMYDVDKAVRTKHPGQSLLFNLDGVAGGAWKIGLAEPAAKIRMDVLDFNIFASGRYTFAEALSRAQISGDSDLAQAALKDLLILY
jgi:uncharacterized protein (TIGR03083 family)